MTVYKRLEPWIDSFHELFQPVSKVVSYCQEFKKEGLNMYALERALEATLNTGKPDAALALMRVMREDGAPLRAHYFWPIIVHYSKLKQKDSEFEYVYAIFSLSFNPLALVHCIIVSLCKFCLQHRCLQKHLFHQRGNWYAYLASSCTPFHFFLCY